MTNDLFFFINLYNANIEGRDAEMSWDVSPTKFIFPKIYFFPPLSLGKIVVKFLKGNFVFDTLIVLVPMNRPYLLDNVYVID